VTNGIVAVAGSAGARHFATSSWPLSSGNPSLLVATRLLRLVAQALNV
jgi:hypothetical protein